MSALVTQVCLSIIFRSLGYSILKNKETNHINNDECQVKGRTKQMHRTLAILKLKIIQTLQITDFDRLLTLIASH